MSKNFGPKEGYDDFPASREEKYRPSGVESGDGASLFVSAKGFLAVSFQSERMAIAYRDYLRSQLGMDFFIEKSDGSSKDSVLILSSSNSSDNMPHIAISKPGVPVSFGSQKDAEEFCRVLCIPRKDAATKDEKFLGLKGETLFINSAMDASYGGVGSGNVIQLNLPPYPVARSLRDDQPVVPHLLAPRIPAAPSVPTPTPPAARAYAAPAPAPAPAAYAAKPAAASLALVNPVKIYLNRAGELSIEFSNSKEARGFYDKFRRASFLNILEGKFSNTCLISKGNGNESVGVYEARNGELAILFPGEINRDAFCKALGMNTREHCNFYSGKDAVAYIKSDKLNPKSPIGTILVVNPPNSFAQQEGVSK